jgi:hypothetical protein
VIDIPLSVALFFCVLGISLLTENKKHNFLIIKKLKNPINDKLLIYPLNNITYIILG